MPEAGAEMKVFASPRGWFAARDSVADDSVIAGESGGNEKRLIRETGAAARIAGLVEPVMEDMGLRLVRVRLYEHNRATLQIMAERPDGTMNVSDCENLSKILSPLLDVEDPIAGRYDLEISSPGIDRPLVRRSDFEIWAGHRAKLETAHPIDGRRRFKGIVSKIDDAQVRVRRDDGTDCDVPLDALADAKLVLSDELVREALRREKAARKAQKAPKAEKAAQTRKIKRNEN